MKKQRKKHFFNMVEVALALLVISLGLSTVLTLFPAGLKATSEAENDNNVAEAAETLFAYLQERVVAGDFDFVASEVNTADTFGVSGGNKITVSGKVLVYHKITSGGSSNIEDFTCAAQVFPAENTGAQATSGGNFFTYMPRFSGGVSVTEPSDFHEPETYHFATANAASGDGKIGSSNLYAYDVELSYPADKAYAEREKRVFRMIFYK